MSFLFYNGPSEFSCHYFVFLKAKNVPKNVMEVICNNLVCGIQYNISFTEWKSSSKVLMQNVLL